MAQMDLLVVRENAGFAVHDDRVRLYAVPQGAGDLQVFGRD